jgi:hypothetical protein
LFSDRRSADAQALLARGLALVDAAVLPF